MGEIVPFNQKMLTIRDLLIKNRGELARAASSHLNIDRLERIAITCIRKTPALADCTPISVVASVMQCAQLGLEPDSMLGRVYLVPFHNKKTGKLECTPIIGYKGMIELSLRSGMVETVEGRAVYKGDHFEYALGLNRKLDHEPIAEADNAALTHAYAIVRFKGGGVLFDVLTRAQIDRIRAKSPGGKNQIWSDYFAEMGIKSVIRRIWKYCPASTELSRAAALDERSEAGESVEIPDGLELVGEDDAQIAEAPKSSLGEAAQRTKTRATAAKKEDPFDGPVRISVEGHTATCGLTRGNACDCQDNEKPPEGQ